LSFSIINLNKYSTFCIVKVCILHLGPGDFFFHQVNIGLALALLRGLTKDDVRTGAWEEKKVKDLFLNLGESLVGKTCGFLGLGKIGLATAHRWTSLDLLDLGLRTVVCSISL